VRDDTSVPDATLSQRFFKLHIETKLGGDLDIPQIKRHMDHRAFKGDFYMIGLTKEKIPPGQLDELKETAKTKGVTFAATTFLELLDLLKKNCSDFEVNLSEVLEDFEAYLETSSLLSKGMQLVVIPCGTSLEQNVEFNIYFEQARRYSKARSELLGLYSQKKIQYIGKIDRVIVGVLDGENFLKEVTEFGGKSEEDIDTIKQMVKACHYFGDFAQTPHRYYFVEKFYKTEIKKITKYGMWGARKFYLSQWLENKDFEEKTVEYISNKLGGKEFE